MDKSDELFAEWISLRAFGDSTRNTYGSMFGVVSAWLFERDTNVCDVSADVLQLFFSERRVSAGTERRYLLLLRDFFDHLIARGVMRNNPALLLLDKLQREPLSHRPARTVPVALTDEEERRLLESLSTTPAHFAEVRRRTMILVMLGCGLSAQEMCDLRWKSILIAEKNELHLQHGQRTRRIPLTNDAAQALEELRKLSDDGSTADVPEEQYVFVKGIHRRPYKPSGIFKLVQSVLKSSGVVKDRISPKTLRSTFAARSLSQGVPLETVQLWLGHGSAATTAIYKREGDAGQ